MKTMMLWLMIQPGVWDCFIDVYKDADECNKAYTILAKSVPPIDLSTHPKKKAHIRSIYFNGSDRPGIMFTRCY